MSLNPYEKKSSQKKKQSGSGLSAIGEEEKTPASAVSKKSFSNSKASSPHSINIISPYSKSKSLVVNSIISSKY